MRAPAPSRVLSFVLVALLPACGAILDLPEPSVNDDFGSDGAVSSDGSQGGDGSQSGDGSQGGDGSSGDGSTVKDAESDTGTLSCATSECTVTTTIASPRGIVGDGSYLYVINATDHIERVDGAGNHIDLATSEPGLGPNIAYANGEVFFTNVGTAGAVAGSVSSCKSTGCSGAGNRVDFTTTEHAFWGIATDGTNVFFTAKEASIGTGNLGGYFYCKISDGAACTLTRRATIDSANAVAVDEARLYLDDATGSRTGVYECDAPTCATLADGNLTSVSAFATDVTNVYWSTDTTIRFRAKNTTGGGTQIVGAQNLIVALAVDPVNGNVYWLDQTANSLKRCKAAATTVNGCTGSQVVDNLATDLVSPQALTLMNGYVYVTSSGKITRVDE